MVVALVLYCFFTERTHLSVEEIVDLETLVIVKTVPNFEVVSIVGNVFKQKLDVKLGR